MYFMVTTMSTVGFGDLHPKSDAERVVCIIIFLGGTTFFSLIMGDFLEIIDTYVELRSDTSDEDSLS